MITNDGKEIISKYLLGQVPAYATHLAIGCGAVPLDANDPISTGNYGKQRLDFEMTRVPISAKGFVDDSRSFSISNKEITSNVATLTTTSDHDIVAGETVIVSGVDDTFNGQFKVLSSPAPTATEFSYSLINADVVSVGVSPLGAAIVSRTKLSLTAELPTDNRYEITEVGIWSAGNNSLTSQYDSRNLFNFTESWQVHGTSISDPAFNSNLGYDGATTTTDVEDTNTVIFANTNDPLFQTNTRKDRKEGPRHLSRTLLVRGDLSTITGDIDGTWSASGTHIHLNGIGFDISGNNSADILKLAFSMIDKLATGNPAVKDVKILMEFFRTESATASGYAKAQIYVPGSILDADRYYVANFTISQDIDYSNEAASTSLPYMRFYTSTDFSPADIRICRMFVAITKIDDSPSTDHYLALDGFRIENTTENPIYKLSGYSVVKKDGYPIIKSANTSNYIDFRFSLGVS